MYYNYGQKDINTWARDEKVKPGCLKANTKYLRELKGIAQDLGKNNIALYLLVNRLKMYGNRQMLISGTKQRRLVLTWCDMVKRRQISKEWEPVFDRTINRLQERVRYIRQIIDENIRLTEYYPFFQDSGYDGLFLMGGSNTDDTEEMLKAIDAYQESHKNEIEAHMESIREEKETHERYQQLLAEKRKAEKDLEKEIGRRAKAESKKTQKQVAARDKKAAELERSFKYLYKQADAYWGNAK